MTDKSFTYHVDRGSNKGKTNTIINSKPISRIQIKKEIAIAIPSNASSRYARKVKIETELDGHPIKRQVGDSINRNERAVHDFLTNRSALKYKKNLILDPLINSNIPEIPVEKEDSFTMQHNIPKENNDIILNMENSNIELDSSTNKIKQDANDKPEIIEEFKKDDIQNFPKSSLKNVESVYHPLMESNSDSGNSDSIYHSALDISIIDDDSIIASVNNCNSNIENENSNKFSDEIENINNDSLSRQKLNKRMKKHKRDLSQSSAMTSLIGYGPFAGAGVAAVINEIEEDEKESEDIDNDCKNGKNKKRKTVMFISEPSSPTKSNTSERNIIRSISINDIPSGTKKAASTSALLRKYSNSNKRNSSEERKVRIHTPNPLLPYSTLSIPSFSNNKDSKSSKLSSASSNSGLPYINSGNLYNSTFGFGFDINDEEIDNGNSKSFIDNYINETSSLIAGNKFNDSYIGNDNMLCTSPHTSTPSGASTPIEITENDRVSSDEEDNELELDPPSLIELTKHFIMTSLGFISLSDTGIFDTKSKRKEISNSSEPLLKNSKNIDDDYDSNVISTSAVGVTNPLDVSLKLMKTPSPPSLKRDLPNIDNILADNVGLPSNYDDSPDLSLLNFKPEEMTSEEDYYNAIIKQLVLSISYRACYLGACFAFVLTAYNVAQSFLTVLQSEWGLYAMATNYGAFSIGSLAAPHLVEYFGIPASMSIGAACLLNYVFALWKNSLAYIMVSSVIAGLGMGLLWIGQGMWISLLVKPLPEYAGHFTGLFFSLTGINGIFGNIMAIILLGSGVSVFTMLQAMIVVGFAGVLMLLFVEEPFHGTSLTASERYLASPYETRSNLQSMRSSPVESLNESSVANRIVDAKINAQYNRKISPPKNGKSDKVVLGDTDKFRLAYYLDDNNQNRRINYDGQESHFASTVAFSEAGKSSNNESVKPRLETININPNRLNNALPNVITYAEENQQILNIQVSENKCTLDDTNIKYRKSPGRASVDGYSTQKTSVIPKGPSSVVFPTGKRTYHPLNDIESLDNWRGMIEEKLKAIDKSFQDEDNIPNSNPNAYGSNQEFDYISEEDEDYEHYGYMYKQKRRSRVKSLSELIDDDNSEVNDACSDSEYDDDISIEKDYKNQEEIPLIENTDSEYETEIEDIDDDQFEPIQFEKPHSTINVFDDVYETESIPKYEHVKYSPKDVSITIDMSDGIISQSNEVLANFNQKSTPYLEAKTNYMKNVSMSSSWMGGGLWGSSEPGMVDEPQIHNDKNMYKNNNHLINKIKQKQLRKRLKRKSSQNIVQKTISFIQENEFIQGLWNVTKSRSVLCVLPYILHQGFSAAFAFGYLPRLTRFVVQSTAFSHIYDITEGSPLDAGYENAGTLMVAEMFLCYGLVCAIFAFGAGKLQDRYGSWPVRTMTVIGTTLQQILIFILYSYAQQMQPWLRFAILAVCGGCAGLQDSCASSVVNMILTKGQINRSLAFAVYRAIYALSTAASAWILAQRNGKITEEGCISSWKNIQDGIGLECIMGSQERGFDSTVAYFVLILSLIAAIVSGRVKSQNLNHN